MIKKKHLLTSIVALGCLPLAAQQQLHLQQCVDLALERNLQLQQQSLTVDNQQLGVTHARLSYLPSINGQASGTRQFGTTFDSFSFTRTSQSTNFLRMNASASLTVFSGLSKYYTLKQNLAGLGAEQANAEKQANQVLTTVLSQYLQIVMDESAIRISQNRLDLLQQQQSRAEKLLAAGAGTEAEVLNLKGQVANEKLNLISSENQLKRDRLLLLQQLQLDVLGEYTFVVPDTASLPVGQELPPLAEVVDIALGTMPEIREAELRLQAAHMSTQVNRGNLSPSLSLDAGLGSNYSSNVNPFLGTERSSLGHQLNDNFFQSIGLTLQIPIFNGWQANRQWQVAQNNERIAQISLTSTQDVLRRQVQQAWLDVQTARTQYLATQEQLRALSEAYTYAQKRYEAGAIDFFSYIESLNNKNRAEIDLIRARFDYFFKQKLLDVYQGKELKF